MSVKVSLSDELQRLGQEFAPYEKNGGRLGAREVRLLRVRLALLTQLARNQEEELAVHRLIEANRAIGAEIDEITAAARNRLTAALGDNVVHIADFQKP